MAQNLHEQVESIIDVITFIILPYNLLINVIRLLAAVKGSLLHSAPLKNNNIWAATYYRLLYIILSQFPPIHFVMWLSQQHSS